MDNILKKIINTKKEKLKIYKNKYSENELLNNIKNMNNFFDFNEKIIRRSSQKKNFHNC